MKRSIRKLLFALSLTLFSGMSFAAGPYDGIWAFYLGETPVFFITVNENASNTLVAVSMTAGHPQEHWDAMIGQRDGTTASLSTAAGVSSYNMSASVEFNSETQATVTINSCEPIVDGATCDSVFIGSALSISKIF